MLLVLSAFLNTLFSTWIPNVLFIMQVVGTAYMLYLAYQIYTMDTTDASENKAGNFSSGF